MKDRIRIDVSDEIMANIPAPMHKFEVIHDFATN